ncbi:hypothetical protein P7C71_g2092, partial [Lecanoromycetidae sp. Uapishka_2]
MGGSGAGSGAASDAGGSGAGQPQGTEYTLQGKLEGDGRTNKRLRESLDKHVRILEHALKKEREKAKAPVREGEAEEKKEENQDVKQAPRPSTKPQPSKPHNSFLDLENEDSASPSFRHEAERDRSRLYLGKCIEEVSYHVLSLPAQQQQYSDEQEQILQNHQYTSNQQPQQQSLEDVYVQQRQKQQPNNIGLLGPSPLPNHQPPPIPRVSDIPPLSRGSQQSDQASYTTRSLPERQARPQDPPLTAIDRSIQPRDNYGFPTREDQVEKVAHSYDAFGRPVPSREEDDNARLSEEPEVTDADGWNFDDPSEPPLTEEQSAPDFAVPQRPDAEVFPSANNTALKSPTRGAPDASVLVYSTRTGEEIVGMASLETYDDTPATGVNAIAATTVGLDGSFSFDSGRGVSEDESLVHGPTGSSTGVEGTILSGHEDRYIRFFDANSGQCTYNMLAHPSAISSLSLSPSATELVSAGHDASLRFWSLEKRSCT